MGTHLPLIREMGVFFLWVVRTLQVQLCQIFGRMTSTPGSLLGWVVRPLWELQLFIHQRMELECHPQRSRWIQCQPLIRISAFSCFVYSAFRCCIRHPVHPTTDRHCFHYPS